MNRLDFIKLLAMSPVSTSLLGLKDLGLLSKESAPTTKFPVLFLGHGSPMNAIEENEFVQGFREVVRSIPTPRAILCISAHWETQGTFVTAMSQPRTIHDFGGFPKALYEVQYPAPGSPALAAETKQLVQKTSIVLDHDHWGLDHGAWSVIKHLYPDANIPIIQMSLDRTQPASYHYELAKELSVLRERGVLIVGSGNMVHNLGLVAWDKLHDTAYAFDWALESSSTMKRHIQNGNHDSLIKFQSQGKAFQLAIPTPEHYLPLLYTLALQGSGDEVRFFNDKPLGGSLTMTSVWIGS